MRLPAINFYFNRTSVIVLILFVAILLYPKPLSINGIVIINDFVKTRVISVGILFLVLKGIIHDYYSQKLGILFLLALILSPTLTFAQLVLVVLAGLVIFKVFKKI